MLRTKKLKIQPYGCVLLMIASDDMNVVSKCLKKNNISSEIMEWWESNKDSLAAAAMRSAGTYVQLIAVFDVSETVTPGKIAHEAKHLIDYIYREVGVVPDLSNDENECYLLGYLVDEIDKFLKRSC